MENPKKKALVTPNEVAEEDIENVNSSCLFRKPFMVRLKLYGFVLYIFQLTFPFLKIQICLLLGILTQISLYMNLFLHYFQLWGKVLSSLEKRKVELKIKIDR